MPYSHNDDDDGDNSHLSLYDVLLFKNFYINIYLFVHNMWLLQGTKSSWYNLLIT